jgi:hypothetical protein
MAQRAARRTTFGVVVSTIASLVVAQAAHAASDAQAGAVATTGSPWGVDTVSNIQSGDILAQTKSDLGNPRFAGRYLIYSSELSSGEAQYLHANSVSIVLIDDPNRSFTSGAADAQQAIARAKALGVTKGVAIFRDVETSDPISAMYVSAYTAAFSGSGFVAGFYENPINGAFAGAFCSAVSGDPSLVDRSVLYSSEPENTGSDPKRSARPGFKPDVPGCANRTAAWQYLERGLFPPGTWPNVDVDEFASQYTRMLWA